MRILLLTEGGNGEISIMIFESKVEGGMREKMLCRVNACNNSQQAVIRGCVCMGRASQVVTYTNQM